jgi:hypothetical protein
MIKVLLQELNVVESTPSEVLLPALPRPNDEYVGTDGRLFTVINVRFRQDNERSCSIVVYLKLVNGPSNLIEETPV